MTDFDFDNNEIEFDSDNEALIQDYVPKDIKSYLTFKSDDVVMGVRAETVIEIIANYMIRPVPKLPEFIKGVINLRGQVLPVIDMRLRMNKSETVSTSETCVVILDIDGTEVGLIVDSVLQVQSVDMNKVSPVPVKNGDALADTMIRLSEDCVALLLNCPAIIANVY